MLLSSCFQETRIGGSCDPTITSIEFDGEWVENLHFGLPIMFSSYEINEDYLLISGRMSFKGQNTYDNIDKANKKLKNTSVSLSTSREYDSSGRSDYDFNKVNPKWEILEQFENCEYSFVLHLNIYGLEGNINYFGTLWIHSPFNVFHDFNE